jgi:putative transposase
LAVTTRRPSGRVPSMGRAYRLGDAGNAGGVFHVTHRCHNRSFLLKFARDRDGYRSKLREHLRQFHVSILDYCITCNHVHLLVDTGDRLALSGFMQEVASEFARAYNRRKQRTNAFWGDNYHVTLVEEGQYLWQCLCYIELNMVRCGVVSHPRDWPWVGYHEIMGARRRYRVVDIDRLCWRMRTDRLRDLQENLETSLAERISRDAIKREGCWTESLAIGSHAYVEKLRPLIHSRSETEIVSTGERGWVLEEKPEPYGQKTGLINACKAR